MGCKIYNHKRDAFLENVVSTQCFLNFLFSFIFIISVVISIKTVPMAAPTAVPIPSNFKLPITAPTAMPMDNSMLIQVQEGKYRQYCLWKGSQFHFCFYRF